MTSLCVSLSGCAIVLAPPGTPHVSAPLTTADPSLTHALVCSCSDGNSYEAHEQWDSYSALSDDFEPVRPELIPPRWKDAGLLAGAHLSDWKDRCRARHQTSCEACKAWFQTKVKPPEEPPWPKFHPIPAAPAFTPREDEVEVEAVDSSKSHKSAWHNAGK
ncbi:hypothetical protein SH467x_003212 [Pirellulaceae bacterium SH467]|jgi:hypothetical protein